MRLMQFVVNGCRQLVPAMLVVFNSIVVLSAFADGSGDSPYGSSLTVFSPDGRLRAEFSTDAGGMRWSLLRDGKTLVKPSVMGFRFAVGNNCDKDSVELAEMKVIGVKPPMLSGRRSYTVAAKCVTATTSLSSNLRRLRLALRASNREIHPS